MKQNLTFADRCVVLLVVGMAVGSYFLTNSSESDGNAVLIQIDGETTHRLLRKENTRLHVRGVRGEVIVETKDDRVAVVFADCPNHACVRSGWKWRAGEHIVCVPNGLIVRIVDESVNRAVAVTG